MKGRLINKLKYNLRKTILELFPIINTLDGKRISIENILQSQYNSQISDKAYIGGSYSINDSKIGDFTSIALNAKISLTEIGKYCSIGPEFISGWGIHPINGLSTSPLFYSRSHSTGKTFSETNKIVERKAIKIGNDVWIGANCFILDGVTIGNGSVIAAGSIVTADVPDYAIVGGVPAKLIKYRFEEDTIKKLLEIKWWDFENEERLKDVEMYFFDIESFINKYSK